MAETGTHDVCTRWMADDGWESLTGEAKTTLTGFLHVRTMGALGRATWSKTWLVVDTAADTLHLAKDASAPPHETLVLSDVTKVALCVAADVAKARDHVFTIHAGGDSPIHVDAKDEATKLAWLDFLADALDDDVVLKYRDTPQSGASTPRSAAESSAGQPASELSVSSSSIGYSPADSLDKPALGATFCQEPSGAVAGMLEKRGEGILMTPIALWKKRYFRLQDGVLSWAKSDIAAPRGSIAFYGPDAPESIDVALSSSSSGGFTIRIPGRLYEMRAKSDPAAAAAWVGAIEAAIASAPAHAAAASSDANASGDNNAAGHTDDADDRDDQGDGDNADDS